MNYMIVTQSEDFIIPLSRWRRI